MIMPIFVELADSVFDLLDVRDVTLMPDGNTSVGFKSGGRDLLLPGDLRKEFLQVLADLFDNVDDEEEELA